MRVSSELASFSGRSNGVLPSTGSPTNQSAFASLQTDSPPPSPVAPPTAPVQKTPAPAKQSSKLAKTRKPAAKRPTPAEAASHVDAEQFKELLSHTATKYKADQQSQLETLADFFIGAFKDSELAFGKLLKDQPAQKLFQVSPAFRGSLLLAESPLGHAHQRTFSQLSPKSDGPRTVALQAADIPFRDLPKALSSPALQYLADIDYDTASQFQLKLIDAAVADLSSDKPKAGQRTQVLLVLALSVCELGLSVHRA